jgi:hypothetical protein
MSRLEQIRRAHASARPKHDNPAWLHTHQDLTYVLSLVDRLQAADELIVQLSGLSAGYDDMAGAMHRRLQAYVSKHYREIDELAAIERTRPVNTTDSERSEPINVVQP